MLLRVFDSELTVADLITPSSRDLVETEAEKAFLGVGFPLSFDPEMDELVTAMGTLPGMKAIVRAALPLLRAAGDGN